MQQFDRRQWLKTAGLTSAIGLFGGLQNIAKAATLEEVETQTAFDGPIRLSSNENPYGPSQKVREAIIKNFDIACRYPYGYQGNLLEMIAKKEGVTPDHIVITGGSTEGLKITGLTYGWRGGEIIAPTPTFLAMLSYAEQFGTYINEVPVNEDLGLDLEEMEKRINSSTRLVFICNPNNPTSTLLDAEQLRDFCRSVSSRTMVFSDEAYYDYIEKPGYPSMIELVKEGLNVIVSRTFSKVYALAGMRIGYLIARPEIASRLSQKRVAFTNVPALVAAKAALEDQEFYNNSLQKNREAKQMIYQTLDDLKLPYVQSHTNFIFFKTGRDINEIQNAMKKQNVLVGRPFPPFTDWCRISTGTIEETEMFCKGIRAVV